MRSLKILAALVLIASLAASSRAQSGAATGGLLVASDGKGVLELRWAPPQGHWPAGGWQIRDDRGTVLIPRVAPGEERYLGGLSARDQETVRGLAKSPPVFKSAEQGGLFVSLQVLKGYSDPAYARAIGLAATLSGVAPGARTYAAVALDAAGRPTGIVLKSAAVDGAAATPLPLPPGGLKAESRPEGVALSWSPAATSNLAPTIGYRVARKDASGRLVTANDKPIYLNKDAGGLPAFIDAGAPVEEDIAYQVFALDVFGRAGGPAEVKVRHTDWAALEPPASLKAEARAGKIALTWKPNPSPRTRSVHVERGYSLKGPFVDLTPKGLTASSTAYEDADVKGGGVYAYRLRSEGPGGAFGAPGSPTSSRALNSAPPPQPRALKAEVGRTRVRLSWTAGSSPVVGYLVEKQAADGTWRRINDALDQALRYDDPLGEETSGTFLYRVRAVGFDNQESPSSAPLTVTIPAKGLPPAPFITGAETRDGRAVIRFKPGLPESRTAQFVVLRGSAPDDAGLVMGRPLPASARVYEDPFVQPGQSYWYRVVALDAAGHRSASSGPALAVIGTPDIPRPAAPKATLLTAPFVQVRIAFAAPPAGLEAVAERKLETESVWLLLPGSTDKDELIDAAPPALGRIQYRVVYRAANGAAGPPSDAFVLVR